MSWLELGGGSGDECVGEALPIVAVVVAWRRMGRVEGEATSSVEGGSVAG